MLLNAPVTLQAKHLSYKKATSNIRLQLSRYDYIGQEKEGKLYNYRARMYDPKLRRFLSPDLAQQQVSGYAFCENNPLLYIDKDGRWTERVFDLGVAYNSIGLRVKNPKYKAGSNEKDEKEEYIDASKSIGYVHEAFKFGMELTLDASLDYLPKVIDGGSNLYNKSKNLFNKLRSKNLCKVAPKKEDVNEQVIGKNNDNLFLEDIEVQKGYDQINANEEIGSPNKIARLKAQAFGQSSPLQKLALNSTITGKKVSSPLNRLQAATGIISNKTRSWINSPNMLTREASRTVYNFASNMLTDFASYEILAAIYPDLEPYWTAPRTTKLWIDMAVNSVGKSIIKSAVYRKDIKALQAEGTEWETYYSFGTYPKNKLKQAANWVIRRPNYFKAEESNAFDYWIRENRLREAKWWLDVPEKADAWAEYIASWGKNKADIIK